MSFAWRAHMTFNKYASIAAKAVRSALKDDARVAAARRNDMSLKYAKWDGGKQGEVKSLSTDPNQA